MTDDTPPDPADLDDQTDGGEPIATARLEATGAVAPRSGGGPNVLVLVITAAVIVTALIGLSQLRRGGGGVIGSPSPVASPSAPATGSGGAALSGGPQAFLDDPRLARCRFAPVAEMEYVFVMGHARDYQRYLPKMGQSPELDIDASALVVIFAQTMAQPPTTGLGPGATNEPGHRYVCVEPDGGDPNLYADVDITGVTSEIAPGG